MEIVTLPIEDITPYVRNAKEHPEWQIEQIMQSIQQYGLNDPLGIWGDKNTVVEGHGRLEALKRLGYTEVPCIRLDHLSDKERREYALVHNKLTMNTDFDFDILADELDGLDFGELDLDWGINKDESADGAEYSEKKLVPQYEPTGEKYYCSELYDIDKTKAYIEEIEKSNVTDEEKEFLIAAAYRHCVINFDRVAEYYASATAEMQRLMEKSALVIIDYDDAIANGFAKLRDELGVIMEDDE